MAGSTFLDPNGDSKADWTETPAGTAFSKLDEATRQPTAPSDVSGDNINVATAATCRVDVGTFTIAGNEAVTSIKAWAYGNTPAGRACDLSIAAAPSGTVTSTVPAGSANAWFSTTYTGGATQAQVNGLQWQVLSAAGTGTVTWYAGYIEVVTAAFTVTSAGTSTTTAALRLTGAGAATSAGTSTTTAALKLAAALAATSAGASTSTGAVTASYALAASSAGTSSSTADLTGVFELEGLSGGTGFTTADLTVRVPTSAQVELGERRTATLVVPQRSSIVERPATEAAFAQGAPTSAQIVGSTPEQGTTLEQPRRSASLVEAGGRTATITSER